MALIGYARVSTGDQKLALQHDALNAAGCERDLIRERINAGLKAAREQGSLGGRRPVITPDKLRKARDHISAGLTVRGAATRLKVGKTALYKALEGVAAKAKV